MSKLEIVELDTRLDFGGLSDQAVFARGTISVSGGGEYVEARVTYAQLTLIGKEQQSIKLDVTHTLSVSATAQLERELEDKYRAYRARAESAPVYDFDGPGAA